LFDGSTPLGLRPLAAAAEALLEAWLGTSLRPGAAGLARVGLCSGSGGGGLEERAGMVTVHQGQRPRGSFVPYTELESRAYAASSRPAPCKLLEGPVTGAANHGNDNRDS